MENRDFDKNKNLFQISINKVFLQSKTNDLLFGCLLIKSFKLKELHNTRVVDKTKISIRMLSQEIYNKDRVCKVQKDLNYLEDCGLIENVYAFDLKTKNKIPHFLQVKESTPFVLISQPIIEHFVKSGVEDALKIYAYLMYKNNTVKKGNCGYNFTIEELLTDCLQFQSTTNSRNRKHVNEVLEFLKLSGLIDYKIVTIKGKNKTFQNFQLIQIKK